MTKASDEKEGINKPVLGVADNVSPETERVSMSDFGGGAPTRVTHPFVSIRSWIRVMPEEGTAAVLTRRGDTAVSEISYYWSGSPESRISKYRQGVGYYRPIDRGEFELSSYGMAQVYGSRMGALDLRGGITRGWLSNEDLEVGFKAPVHRRVLHDNSSDAVRGEERFGVVWRRPGFTERIAKNTLRSWKKVDGSFAKEYVRTLSFGGTPAVLVDHREGHVFEDDGSRPLAPTRKPLRRRTVWYDSRNEPSTDMMDEDGNSWEILSPNATSGRTFRVPNGRFVIEAGTDIRLRASKDINCTATNMVVKVNDVIHIEADIALKLISRGMIQIDAPIIELNGRAVNIAIAPI